MFSDFYSCVSRRCTPTTVAHAHAHPLCAHPQQLCARSYIVPSCREIDVEEIVTKSIGAVTFTTSIIETIELAYPCNGDSADAAAKQARCAAWNVTVEQTGVQCRCSHAVMYYVKGVEKMGVAFEHAYTTTENVNGGLAGSSAVQGEKLDTKVHWSNGTEHECTPPRPALAPAPRDQASGSGTAHAPRGPLPGSARPQAPSRRVRSAVAAVRGRRPHERGVLTPRRTDPAGEEILLTLEELISLNRQGFDLDSLNDDVQQDARDVANMPYFRTTGMKVTVDLKYDNKMNGKAVANNNDIDATVDVEAAGGWAGAGPQVFFVQAPSYDADGARSAEKMIRYRQGVEVVFRASGLVYAFDTQHFMNTLLSAYLFLAFAVYVMDFVTFNLLPNGISKVLYAKRAERVSKLHTFAQLGLKAAVAVKDFKSLDYDEQGFIDVKNLVSVFGGIPTIGKEQALLIAQTIIRAADTDTNLKEREPPSACTQARQPTLTVRPTSPPIDPCRAGAHLLQRVHDAL